MKRILGRVSVHDIQHPLTGDILVEAGEEKEDAAKKIQDSPIESVKSVPFLLVNQRKVFVQNVIWT